MIQLPKEFDSIFRYIVVVSQRAEQLINGAKPRVESRHTKPTLKARDDVDGGAVSWRVLTQEELEAHRQALVEQFRAEMDATGDGDVRQPIPDVLPTGVVVDVDDDEDRDDELMRLQKLLGMTRGGPAAGEAAAEGDEESGDENEGEIELDLDEDFEEPEED
jgi:DNA-directed RNA polymerase subunit K/omega